MSQRKIFYTMKSYGMEDKYYHLDSRFKNNEIPRIDDAQIAIAIDNYYDKIFYYVHKLNE